MSEDMEYLALACEIELVSRQSSKNSDNIFKFNDEHLNILNEYIRINGYPSDKTEKYLCGKLEVPVQIFRKQFKSSISKKNNNKKIPIKKRNKASKDKLTKPRKKRHTYSQEQTFILNQLFEEKKVRFPSKQMRQDLAKKLHVQERQIQVWFQNRRSKEKKMTTYFVSNSTINYYIN